VKGHHDLATRRDLGKGASHSGHDRLGASLNVVVASTESLTTGSGGVTLEAGGVLLEGVSARAVTGSSGVNWERMSGKARLAGDVWDLPPMADPAPPMSPTALMIAP